MNNPGPAIYIVDDDVSVCRALSLLLKSHGFKVETFMRAADFLSKGSNFLVIGFKFAIIHTCK